MKLEQASQEILLRQLNEGEEVAFEYVFREYYASLCFFANKFLRDREAAKDVVQEVFLHFYEIIHTLAAGRDNFNHPIRRAIAPLFI